MKPGKMFSLFSSVIVCLLFITCTNAQEPFSGEVGMKITDDKGNTFNMDYLIKNDLLRLNSAAGGYKMGIIFNSTEKKMIMLMDDQKMYMEMPTDMINQQMGTNEDDTDKEVDFKPTGETKEILGYTCEKWVYSGDDNNAEVWMAKNIGNFKFFDGGGMGKPKRKANWETEIEKSGYFPMLVINKDKNGTVLNQLEVTSVKKKSVDDSHFKIPADYQKFSMPNMQ